MQQQMEDLYTAAEQLPPDQSPELLRQIDALNADLDIAMQGQAESGWSNAEIVDTVGSLCGHDGLVEWIVQPWIAQNTLIPSDSAPRANHAERHLLVRSAME